MTTNIPALLDDRDARLSPSACLRWEGALTALEAIPGKAPSLLGDEPGRVGREVS